MFCPTCGNQLPDSARFCTKCGAFVGAPEPQTAGGLELHPVASSAFPAQPAPQPQPVPQPVPSPMPTPAPQPQQVSPAPVTYPQPQQQAIGQPVAAVGSEPVVIKTEHGKRTAVTVPMRLPTQMALNRAAAVLQAERFEYREYKGEMVWKKGTGLATAMQYVKLMPLEGHYLQIQGWVQAGLGDVGFSELALDGVVAIIPKKMVKGVIDKVVQELERP